MKLARTLRCRARHVAAAIGGRLCVAALLSAAIPLDAQLPPAMPDDTPRVIDGRVARPAGDTLRGVGGVWVVLHRVASDTAGPLDSTRTRADGTYRIGYRPRGDERTIYFVSANFAGIAYFSPPLPAGNASEEEAELIVYDTTSVGIPLRVAGRHLVISAPRPDGARDVVEVYEIANDSSRTLISPDDQRPTWTGRLPAGATDFRVGEGDVAEEAVHIAGDTLAIVAPIAPGLKQFSLAYRLPPNAFPLNVAMDAEVATLEVLLEDPASRLEGAGLTPTDPVTVEGREFRRFQASNVAQGDAFRVEIPVLTQSRRTLFIAVILIAVMAAMLIALARAFGRRQSAEPVIAKVPPVPRSADALAREIAALDKEAARTPADDHEMREAFAARRAALKDALARALASGDQPR